MRRRLGLEAAAVAPSLAAGLGLCRLTRAPGALPSVVPVILCVTGGHLAAAAIRWTGSRLGAAWSVLGGVVAVALVSVWWFVPGATTWGWPTAETARSLGRVLSSAFAVIEVSSTPVATSTGVVLCVAAGAGLVAVGARALLPGDLDSPGAGRLVLGILPSAGLFVYAALLSADADRVAATVGYLGGLLVFFLVTDQARARRAFSARDASPAHRRPVAVLALLAVAVAGALAVPLAVSPALAAMRVHALNSTSGAPGARGAEAEPPAVADDAVTLSDDLDGVPAASLQDVLFVARTPVPTYWQVATLTSFDGLSWDSDVATLLADGGVRPVPASPLPSLAQPATATTMDGSVTIEHLRGSLLPVPIDTVSVEGGGVHLDPNIGLDAPSGARPGLGYSVVARQPSVPPSAGAGAEATDAASLAPYLQVPSLPRDVVALAHRIVAGDHDPVAAAASLARFFDDGRFRYSLEAPAGGENALEQFLFTTRAGVCQQFAGAYGVLARVDGLPTRIAVGFNAGTAMGDGVYQVTGADAHVWPEVYLGPSLGWVSFEPTPLVADTVRAAGVVYGSPHVPGSGPPAPGVFQNPRAARNRGAEAATGSSTPAPTATPTRPASPVAGGRSSTGSSAPWSILGIVVVVAGALAMALRRRRLVDVVDSLRCRLLPPRRAVAVRWEQAERAMGRRHLGRLPSETMAEHAARVFSALEAAAPASTGPPGAEPGPGPALVELAGLAARVSYSGRAASSADAERARRLSSRVRARSFAHSGR